MIELKNKQNQELKEYILALDNPEKKELVDIGNELFPNSVKRNLETQRGVEIDKQNVESDLATLRKNYKQVFALSEIKSEILEYNLNFKVCHEYRGDYGYDYIDKIRSFIKDNNLKIPINDLRYHFYVLTSSTTKKDPLIFYKYNMDGHYYFVIIDGDRNYVNITNWFLGYARYSKLQYSMSVYILSWFILSFICQLFALFIDSANGWTISGPALLLLVSFIPAAISADAIDKDDFLSYKVNRLTI